MGVGRKLFTGGKDFAGVHAQTNQGSVPDAQCQIRHSHAVNSLHYISELFGTDFHEQPPLTGVCCMPENSIVDFSLVDSDINDWHGSSDRSTPCPNTMRSKVL